MKPGADQARYPGILTAGDGSSAVVAMETAASEAAGACPVTPSTSMGDAWMSAAAAGARNVNGRSLIAFSRACSHAGLGPFFTPRIRRPAKRGQPFSFRSGSITTLIGLS